MHLVKRVEVIASSKELHKILEQVDEIGITSYSIIRDVVGRNRWGEVSDDSDLAATTLSNVYILIFCNEDQMKQLLARVRPLLNKWGGACYISDSMEVRSMRCVASI